MNAEKVYHEVRLAHGGSGAQWLSGDKETVTLIYRSAWRGRPVLVDMEANRYVHSSGWSEWRIFASGAHEVDENGERDYRAADPTQTARHKLSAQLTPAVEEWLASDAYPSSEMNAYVDAIKNVAGHLRYDSQDLRTAIVANRSKITGVDGERLLAVADAFDAFRAALDAV